MKNTALLLAAIVVAGFVSCKKEQQEPPKKERKVIQAEAVINPMALAGEWTDSTTHATIVLDGEGGMRGGEKGTAYTQWGVAHEDMLIFKGKRDGKEVFDTAMLDVNSVPIRVKVDKTGTIYVMKQVPVKDK